ncbi:hypothetical protein FACS189452_09140 [Bacteroidia bacterium]|nr:hypothetical protein FACS189452_09140 [Bacteroidia bacterium]
MRLCFSYDTDNCFKLSFGIVNSIDNFHKVTKTFSIQQATNKINIDNRFTPFVNNKKILYLCRIKRPPTPKGGTDHGLTLPLGVGGRFETFETLKLLKQ